MAPPMEDCQTVFHSRDVIKASILFSHFEQTVLLQASTATVSTHTQQHISTSPDVGENTFTGKKLLLESLCSPSFFLFLLLLDRNFISKSNRHKKPTFCVAGKISPNRDCIVCCGFFLTLWMFQNTIYCYFNVTFYKKTTVPFFVRTSCINTTLASVMVSNPILTSLMSSDFLPYS